MAGDGWQAHALGAEGIEMGTRFIATKECVHASKEYKQALLQTEETGTVVIKRSLGAPARTLAGGWTEKILRMEEDNADYDKLKDYISGDANRRFIHDGDDKAGFGYAGQVAGMIEDIPSVVELIGRMVKQAEEIRRNWA